MKIRLLEEATDREVELIGKVLYTKLKYEDER